MVAKTCDNNECANGSPDGLVGVLLGNGDGTFQTSANFDSGEIFSFSMALADLNGDDRPDLAVVGPGVGVLLNNTGPHTPTVTTLVSNVNPAVPKQLVTYTATLTGQPGVAVTGKVVFRDGSLQVATVTLADNQAVYSTKYNVHGAHPIIATYSGDLHNSGSISATLKEYIGLLFPVPSTTVLTTSGSPIFVGQSVTITAAVTPSNSVFGTIPDGELVTFFDGATAIGTGATASGVATFVTSSLTAKTHILKGTYDGDTIFKPSSGTVKQVVDGYPTTTTLTSSPNPSNSGQKVILTATVVSAGPVPTGKVRFLDGTTGIGSATLSGGIARLGRSTLTVGTHPITAQYLGNAASAKSTSSVVNQVVQ
jgi:hypothetical protein